MQNATTADARAGYEIFRLSNFTATRQEINDALGQAGHNPVSDRMMRHYGNLARTGYNRYVSINRFDISHAARPYEDLGSEGRYTYVGTDIGVRVTFARDRRMIVATGRAAYVGETGALIEFSDRRTVRALQEKDKPKRGEDVRLDFLDPPHSADAQVTEVDITQRQVTIEVDFARLESLTDFAGRQALPTRSVRFTVQPEGAEGLTSVDVVGRQLFALFEVVEASRSLVNRTAQLSGADSYAEVPEVERLSMQSPLVAMLGAPPLVTQIAGSAVALLGALTWYERWRKARLTNNGVEIENKVSEAKADVERARADLQVDAINRLRQDFTLTDEDAQTLGIVYDRQVLRAVEAFADLDVDHIAVEEDPEEHGAE